MNKNLILGVLRIFEVVILLLFLQVAVFFRRIPPFSDDSGFYATNRTVAIALLSFLTILAVIDAVLSRHYRKAALKT